jgi:hypothetical protein
MRIPFPTTCQPQVGIASGLLLAFFCLAGPAAAQGPASKAGRPGVKANPLEVKRLDAKLEEVRESFLRDTTNLILSYDRMGQYERAKTVLESLQKLDPRNEAVKTKLAELNEKIIESNEFKFDIEPGGRWQPVGTVTKDRAIRIQVAGDYKLSLELASGPDGVPTDDPAEDLVAHVPMGAVTGVIAPAGAAGKPGSGSQNDKPPRPFNVGSSYEKPADRDGMLYLKVNVPPGTRCVGKLTAKISGPERSSP